jgi:flavin-dependent dehydrogenase
VPDSAPLKRAAIEKIAQAAARSEGGNFETVVFDLGQRIGSQIYDAYLAGKVAPGGLRRLFLAHLDEPGLARKVCGSMIAKLKFLSRPLARAAHA